MAADCELGGCAVLAVGRCARCGQAFCGSHQATFSGWPSPALCSRCKAAREAAEQEAAAAHRRTATQHWPGPHGARRILADAGVAMVEVHQRRQVWRTERGLFGQKREVGTDQLELVGRGWLLGEIGWEYNEPGRQGGVDHTNNPAPTVLLEHDPAGAAAENQGCVRVERDGASPLTRIAQGHLLTPKAQDHLLMLEAQGHLLMPKAQGRLARYGTADPERALSAAVRRRIGG